MEYRYSIPGHNGFSSCSCSLDVFFEKAEYYYNPSFLMTMAYDKTSIYWGVTGLPTILHDTARGMTGALVGGLAFGVVGAVVGAASRIDKPSQENDKREIVIGIKNREEWTIVAYKKNPSKFYSAEKFLSKTLPDNRAPDRYLRN